MELWVPLEVYPCISNSVCKDLQTQLHEVLFKRKKGKCQYLPRDKNNKIKMINRCDWNCKVE